MSSTLPAGRTDRADAASGRGNHSTSESCLPKPELGSGPEEHGNTGHPQFHLRTNKELAKLVEQEHMREQVAKFAPHIKNNRHLKRIIAKIPIEQRLLVYKALLPSLNFKPLSFLSIKPR